MAFSVLLYFYFIIIIIFYDIIHVLMPFSLRPQLNTIVCSLLLLPS